MKRNKNLIPLSKDHHYGLLFCWKIQQGVEKEISYHRIRDYINFFWNHHLEKHFATEDEALPELKNEALYKQMEKEHREIRNLIIKINESEDPQLLLDFAKLLHAHIRFEERVLFPDYEANLSQSELEKIGASLAKNPKEEEDYPDEFWNQS